MVETSTAPPKKMSSSTINTKEIISQRNMEKTNHLPPGRTTARLNRSDTHRIDLDILFNTLIYSVAIVLSICGEPIGKK